MAQAVLTGLLPRFPAGTVVFAYPQPQARPGGAPVGASVTSTTVDADGTATFAGLTPEAKYVGYALLGGTHTYVNFSGDTTPSVLDGSIVASSYNTLQAALDDAKYLGYLNECRYIVRLGGHHWTITDTLQVDTHFVILDGEGATITATATDRPAIYCTATADQVEGQKTWTNMVAALRNFTLVGPGQSQLASSGLFLYTPTATSTTLGPARISIENISISGFGVGIGYRDNTYGIVHKNIGVYQCQTGIYMPFNVTNAGERMTYVGGFVGNCKIAVNNSSSGCNMEFFGVSFDYPTWDAAADPSGVAGTTDPLNLLIYVSKGNVDCFGCHFESNIDSDYWFRLGDASSKLGIFGGRLQIAASKSAYEVFYVGQTGTSATSVEQGGLVIDGLHIHQSASYNYGLTRLVAGDGRAQVSRVTWEKGITTWVAPFATALGMLDGTFAASGALSDWTLTSSTAGSEPTIDAANFNTASTSSLKFLTATSGHNSKAFANVTARPGQLFTMSFWNKITGATAGSVNFKVTIKQFRASGVQFGSSVTYGNSSGADLWRDTTGWALRQIAPVTVGRGVTSIQVLFEASAWPTSATAWVNDLTINVI